MRKGCFLTVIVGLTLTLIIVFYIINFHGEDLLEAGKDKLVEFAQESIENDISKLEDNKYVDSLKIVIGDYFSNIEHLDVAEELKRIEELSDGIEVIFLDSKIDSVEFDFITNILVKHGQREEN